MLFTHLTTITKCDVLFSLGGKVEGSVFTVFLNGRGLILMYCDHCCNLVKDREAICMEMRQKPDSAKQDRSHSIFLVFP